MAEGSKLSELDPLGVAAAGTDLLYLVRGSDHYRALVSDLRITASQISDAAGYGVTLLTAADAAAARTALGLGALAVIASVGTSNIDAAAVTLAKLDDLAENNIIVGDASDRPTTLGLGAVGIDLMQAASAAAGRTALGFAATAAAIPDTTNVADTMRDTINAILAVLRVTGGNAFIAD